ncbi:MAG: MATE family efflux transporter [Bacteroidaceae bacterium]|nr:MATE family efflux transporter [Bacteroidaceae bacterium]
MLSTTDRRIRSVALPAIATNVTVPLLGLADTAITGHLGAAAYIGAVAVGGMAFNMMYWLLGFLRMATSGLTAQAHGSGNTAMADAVRWQAGSYGLLAGMAIVVLQWPLLALIRFFFAPQGEVDTYATTYFLILVWGAPAVLATNSLCGWFLGMQDARSPMLAAVVQNVVNIALSLLFVIGFGMKIEGVAAGTLLAQWTGLGVAVWRYRSRYARRAPLLRLRIRGDGRFFSVSRDIFLRTLCLVAVMSWFTRTGTAFGEVTLAANTVLMQFFIITSYVFDGLANAAEAIGGSLFGARDAAGLKTLLRRLFVICAVAAAGFTLCFAIGGAPFIDLLTDRPEVREAARRFLPYLVGVPAACFTAFLLDGLFIGCTRTRAMLLSVAASALLFFVLLWWLSPTLGNHALWTAYLAYLFLRGCILLAATPALLREASAS